MKERLKLIACDIDGTLLRDDYSLSEETVSYISALGKRGILFVLASGRPPRSIIPYYKALGLNTPIISYNGALVYSPSSSDFPVIKRAFPKEEVLEIYAKASSFLLGFQAESEKSIYRLKEDPALLSYFWEKDMAIHQGDPLDTLMEDPLAVVFKCAREDDERLKEMVEAHPSFAYRHWSDCLFSELSLKGVSKGEGLRAILSYYGIPKEDCYAFGDSHNDAEMLRCAGHAFAMKNAKAAPLFQEFQSTAFTNEEDGLLHELRLLFD